MLKVVAVVDKEGTAIDRLAQGLKPFMKALDYEVVDVHPKRPDEAQLSRFESLARDADVISYDYFRTAEMLRQRYPWLLEKKSILTHYNPYSITESDWFSYDKVIACNKYIQKELGCEYIPLAIDTDFWTFNTNWEPNRTAIMVANRIESKKGILEAAIACGEAGLKMHLIGAISDRNYFEAILATGAVEFHEQISDQALRDLYYKSTIHICNSVDGFESGTLPILEAMMCGVPVVTRRVGHVPDFGNDENLTYIDCENTNVLRIKEILEDLINDKERLKLQREAAWKTAKGYSNERRAYQYLRAYRSLFADQPVSVIVPIFQKPEITSQTLNAIAEQDYDNIELIIVDDDLEGDSRIVSEFARSVNFPVRYLNTGTPGYNLAKARNLGAIEASSDILIFCDQRMTMQPRAIREFVNNLVPRSWPYGNKGGKKDFVENFSCVYRQEFIDFGMFNERIDEYGGQSQEIRARARTQGFQMPYVETAKATPSGKSGNKNSKRAEIIRMKNRLWRMGLQ